MIVKIHKRWCHPLVGWLPYMLLNVQNMTQEEYDKLHKESDYADYKYEIED